MKQFELIYKPYGEHSILVEWPAIIDENILQDVLQFKNSLLNIYIKEKVYIKSAYNSILVSYQFTIRNIYDKISELKCYYSSRENIIKSTFRLWRIPVCYDTDFGIDLDVISEEIGLTKNEIIQLHSDVDYTVYFIGFLPGFLYLGGLNEKLHFPRKKTPRLHIEKGAVAIGGKQTGVYPNVSPGGWNIIGNSPINFFDVSKEIPCFAKAGDKVRFYSVSKREYHDINVLIKGGVYQLESEVIND